MGMERREFIRSSCNACLLMAAGYLLPELTGCSPKYSVFKTDIVDKKIALPLTAFQKSSLQLVRPNGWFFDIAVEKKEENDYLALLLQCTHQENQLTAMGTNGFYCSLHGSRFDSNGNVLKGPAEQPLERYKTYVENNNLIIEVPRSPQ
jgi:Rieske Fe-S protein